MQVGSVAHLVTMPPKLTLGLMTPCVLVAGYGCSTSHPRYADVDTSGPAAAVDKLKVIEYGSRYPITHACPGGTI